MSTLLVLAAAAWLFWNLSFRAVYISLKYRNARPIPYPGGMDKENIFQLLKEKLDYPTKKALYYNERGEITIECKYGQHVLTIDNSNIYIGRNGSHHAKNTEEAECLDSYIRKIFNPNEPVNPYRQYKKMKSHRKNWILIQVVVIIACIIAFSIGAGESDLGDAYMSNNISVSYLTQYSSTISIGDAFDNFFDDGKWSSYAEGALNYVDYTGSCRFGNENVNVVIRFWTSDTEFKVHSVFIDGEEASILGQAALLEAIYSN